jgi:hypothetical protein
VDSGSLTINGTVFEQREFLIDREADDYYVLSFAAKVKNNYFLVIDVSYWPENTRAKEAIVDSITKGLTIY